MLRRVRKEDFKADYFIKPDGLAVCLDCWKDWMLSDDRDLSASRMQLRAGEDEDRDITAYESNPNDEQRKDDFKVGSATGAIISEDLNAVHRWAIFKKCGIATVWKYPNLDFMAVITEAEDDLAEKLKKNLVTANKFK